MIDISWWVDFHLLLRSLLVIHVYCHVFDHPFVEVWELMPRIHILVAREADYLRLLVQQERAVGVAPPLLVEIV